MNTVLFKQHESLYKRFHLKNYETKLLQYFYAREIDGIASANYFIIPNAVAEKNKLMLIDGKYFYRLQKNEYKFSSCDLLNKHGLMIGSFDEAVEVVSFSTDYLIYLVELKNLILDEKLDWITEFLKIIHAHLMNRYVTKQSSLNKEFVGTMMNDVILHINAAEDYRNHAENVFSENIFQCQSMAIRELKLAVQLLAKLYGGRSFLAGSIVEMMMIFEYFRDVYFG